jgi:hypothetical protein
LKLVYILTKTFFNRGISFVSTNQFLKECHCYITTVNFVRYSLSLLYLKQKHCVHIKTNCASKQLFKITAWLPGKHCLIDSYCRLLAFIIAFCHFIFRFYLWKNKHFYWNITLLIPCRTYIRHYHKWLYHGEDVSVLQLKQIMYNYCSLKSMTI